MGKLTVLLLLALVTTLFCPVLAESAYPADAGLAAEARQGLEEILDLWRDGKYAELYERTTESGKETKERFINRLIAAPLKPACCWEKMQDVRVTVKKENVVAIRAKIGLEGGVANEYKTRSFKLMKEDGVWKISQTDILNIAGATKAKKRHYLKRK